MTSDITLKKILAYQNWRHRVDLGNGICTMGYNTIESDWDFYFMPEDLTGKTVLDIGANDGYYSFEAEKRGATEVTAIDIYTGDSSTMKGGWSAEGITMLKEHLKSGIEIIPLSVMDIKEMNRKWDVVFCNDVLSWLDNIPQAMEIIGGICSEKLVIRDTFSIKGNQSKIEDRGYGKGSLKRMNLAFLKKELAVIGFSKIRIRRIYSYKHYEWQAMNFPSAFSDKEIDCFELPEIQNQKRKVRLTGEWILTKMGEFAFIQGLGWVRLDEISIADRSGKSLLGRIKSLIPDAILAWYYGRNSAEPHSAEFSITAEK